LLDLHLPVMGGLDFLQRFREDHADVPVIILTGAGTLRAAQRAIRHGVTDFLTKPCHLGDLEAAVERVRRRLAADTAVELEAADGDEPAREDHGTRPSAAMAEIERDAILAAIHAHGGNRTAAAQALGISRRTLHYRLADYRQSGLLKDA